MSIDDVGAPLDALTVVQCVTPPFLPANAEVMTVTVDYPPGCPASRRTATAGRSSVTCSRAKCFSSWRARPRE
ncbi:putative cupin domain-containing protein [Mycobacterium intracellulare 1956]|uniref:Putative cupin domain-containing protein n=1 Tax=Mycobacterium intracellulare 1956 TaxID=1299331 RepID=X8CLE5_MYCIT|nr:putative cupin domain-containing protein [Mycobacterium intracellulare 1956]